MVYVVLMIQTLMASGTHIVAKAVVAAVDPVVLTLTRSLIASVAMGGLLYLRGKRPSIARADYKLLLFLSFLVIPINQFCFLFGMKYTVPSHAALLYATTPILVLLFSRVFLGERLAPRKIAGVALGFVGVVIVIFERGLTASMQYVFGNLIIFLGVNAWGLYTVFGRNLILKYGAIGASSATIIVGTMLFVPIGIVPTWNFSFENLPLSNWFQISYLGIVTSVFAYYLWYYAIARIEVGKVAVFTNLQPILTTILAVLVLGQSITAAFIIGGIIAISGVVVAQFG